MSEDIRISIPDDLLLKMRNARSVVVLTGAGVSAESGIPTFRDSQTGLWAKYDPHQLATPQAFSQNPQLVMDWYRWRNQLIANAAPNPGHYALAEMENRFSDFSLVTQNVDGLHQKAGSRNVIELHGNIKRLICSNRECQYHSDHWPEDLLPTCPICGDLLRPGVVWFGEALPASSLRLAFEVARKAEIVFAIGTSGVVEPAASLPYEALRAGATVIEINPQLTPLSVYTQYSFTQSAGIFLPRLVDAAWSEA